MAKTKVRMFTVRSWSSRTKWSKDKINYNVTTTAQGCPESGEDINVGTAGTAGLSQHMGNSKCKKNVEWEKKQQKEGKMWTLFDRIGVKKVNVVKVNCERSRVIIKLTSSVNSAISRTVLLSSFTWHASTSRVLQKIGVARVMRAQKSGVIRNFSSFPCVCEENVKCFSWNFYPFGCDISILGRWGGEGVTYQCLKKFTDPV